MRRVRRLMSLSPIVVLRRTTADRRWRTAYEVGRDRGRTCPNCRRTP